ncbi:hypothetical protein HU200_060851 [Digitaria exilis]|uniref:DUF7477 domain-containing protein n=1 Tax=Digitaria exilis TaxID=1010633 RepID=A0A835DYG3_9POAL|nr:hypothetical protein HU200_060851 [Digitaria exilis]
MAATMDQSALILSKPRRRPRDETQETLRTTQFPSQHVKEKWAKNLYLAGICYGRTPAQSSFAAQLLLLPAFSFSPLAQPRPNFLSGPFRRRGPVVRFPLSFSLFASLTGGPHLSVVVFFPEPIHGDAVSVSLLGAQALVSPALISRRLDSFEPQPKARVSMVRAAAAIRPFEVVFAASNSSSRLSPSRRRRNRTAARRREPPPLPNPSLDPQKRIRRGLSSLPSQTRRVSELPSPSYANSGEFPGEAPPRVVVSAAASMPVRSEPIEPTRVKPNLTGQPCRFAKEPLENDSFEGDQDQVFEEELPQYFEQGKWISPSAYSFEPIHIA